MDYQTAENQAIQLQNEANQVGQSFRQLADKLQAKVTDPALARELMLDLRETAVAMQQQNQSSLALIQQMAEYIHSLETHINSQPQPTYATRGWSAQPYAGGGGGGFMGNVMSGLGMGAGFGLASDLVGSIFNSW